MYISCTLNVCTVAPTGVITEFKNITYVSPDCVSTTLTLIILSLSFSFGILGNLSYLSVFSISACLSSLLLASCFIPLAGIIISRIIKSKILFLTYFNSFYSIWYLCNLYPSNSPYLRIMVLIFSSSSTTSKLYIFNLLFYKIISRYL